MRKQTMGLTKHMLAGLALVLAANLNWAATMETPVQAAGGGASADEYVKKSDLGFQWNGDARIRVDLRDRSDGPAGGGEVFRPRLQGRVRIGAGGQFADNKAAWGLRLATYGNAVTRNVVLAGGDLNGLGGLDVGVDQAWMAFQPHPDVVLTAGKMPNMHGASTALFDDDLTPSGANVAWNMFHGTEGDLLRNVSLTLGYYPIRELALATADPFAILSDLTSTLGPVDLGVGFYFYNGLNAVPFGGAAGMAQAGNQVRANGLFVNDQMAVIDGRASWGFDVRDFPMTLSGEVFANVLESTQSLGYEARLDLPDVLKGSAWLLYRDVGQDATFSPWADSELGEGTGFHSGVKVGYRRALTSNVDLTLNWMRFDSFQPLTAGPSRTTNRVLVDLSAAF